MNYYIQGNKDKAAEIKAAFEKLGYEPYCWTFETEFYFTVDCTKTVQIVSSSSKLINIIKTHPDYKELELPVEPKFNVGDWLVYKNGNCFAGGLTEAQVVKVKNGVYFFASGSTGSFKFIDENCRLWAIADAKGADLLLQKMEEVGYEWDAEKKELRKIQPHYDIKNFHAGMPVLVRDSDEKKWLYTIFGMYNKDNKIYPFVVVDMRGYPQCIPFEGNEHLLGTTDMCDEQYINW